MRWQHPERGLVPPNDFLPVAEQAGLITRDRTLRARRGVPQGASVAGTRGCDFGKIAVNLSAKEFMQPSLISTISNTLATHRP